MQKYISLDLFTKKVCDELALRIHQVFGFQVSVQELAQALTQPPQEDLGHQALPCFILSKILKKKPNEIAGLLAKACSDSLVFQKALAEGPYLNLFFQKNFLKDFFLKPLLANQLFTKPKRNFSEQGYYLIEYSQPNTHKELHIGHLRNLCFGLALVSLLKKRGFPVQTCTFPGDSGLHTAKCLWYLKYHNKETAPPASKGAWLGKIYTKACRRFEEEQKNNQVFLNQQITNILQQLYKKEGEFYSLWRKTKQWSYQLMLELYEWVGAEFDRWYWESEMDQPSVQWVKELYHQKKLHISEGAIGLDLGKDLGFCLLLKSDGNGLYATKDLYLIKEKFKNHKILKNIYIVDQRQERHFQQVFSVLDKIGFPKQAKSSLHLKYNFVELKTGAMSSRKGNVVPIMELVDSMQSYITAQFLDQYKDKTQWPKEKKNQVAKQIAEGAVKYGMNEQDTNKKIVFDKEEWLRLDGRSGPYIQYAYARACTLLKKLAGDDLSSDSWSFTGDLQSIEAPEEWQLLVHMTWFLPLVEKSCWQMKTSSLCYYLFDLARKFSQFYQNCPIQSLADKQKKQMRIALVKAAQMTLKEGLSYLTIPAPEQM